MKHPLHVEGFPGSNEDLAREILKLRYDKVAKVFEYLKCEVVQESEKDKKAGRVQLADLLYVAAGTLEDLETQFERIYDLCKPYMKDESESS